MEVDGDLSTFITVYPIQGLRGRYEYQFWIDGKEIKDWQRWFYEAFEPEDKNGIEDGETWFWVCVISIAVLSILIIGLSSYGIYRCYKSFKGKGMTYPDQVHPY